MVCHILASSHSYWPVLSGVPFSRQISVARQRRAAGEAHLDVSALVVPLRSRERAAVDPAERVLLRLDTLCTLASAPRRLARGGARRSAHSYV